MSFDLVKLIDSSPEVLKNAIKDVDLTTLDNNVLDEILEKIISNKRINLSKKLQYIFFLIDNPKGGIDINTEIFKVPILFYFIELNKPKIFKHLVEKYNADLTVIFTETISAPQDQTLLMHCMDYDAVEIAEILLKNDADVNMKVNGYGYMEKLNRTDFSFERALPFYNLFLKYGIDIDQIITVDPVYADLNSEEIKLTTLIYSLINEDSDRFDLCIDNEANVNRLFTTNFDGPGVKYTPLSIAIYTDIDYVESLIANGANVNYTYPKFEIDNITYNNLSILQECIYKKYDIDIIKLLLDSGADKDHKETTTNKTALEIAKDKYNSDKEYYKKVIKLLGGELPEKELWKGFSRSDIEKFDIFFENPFDWSCCPICLEYIERSEACMFMSHDCAKTGHYYHEDLYDYFMYSYGTTKKVEWCTICGRITELHKHYKLTDAKNPSKEKAPLKPEIQERLDRGDNQAFFDNANCMGFGGGGIEEKAARFRRLREYALELQEDVDKKQLDEVMKELIEEVWNAPLVRNRKIKKILADKKWNINVEHFPEDKRNSTRNNNNSNAANAANAANVPFNGRKPTIVDEDCIVLREDEPTNTRETNPKFHFNHETVGGIDHDGIYICQKDLAQSVQLKNAEFGLEDFGKCWFSPCKGILHPEELKGIIPEVIYSEYKKKFNKKMAKKGGGRTRKVKKEKQRGGNVKSMLHELKDGTCSPHKLKKPNGK
jgi:hypothetical protein